MSNARTSSPLQILLNLSHIDNGDRLQLAALVGTFAPESALYKANATLKDAVDALIRDGDVLDAASKETDAKKQAHLAAIVVRGAAEQQFDASTAVLKVIAQKACKTEQDIQSLGLHRRPPKAPPAPLVPPSVRIAKPGKEKGSIEVQAQRVPGLSKYVAEICVGALSPEGFKPLLGTGLKRKLVGYPSGQECWIRFATERGATRSAWSEPVPVVAR